MNTYMQDLALNVLQGLIYHKTKPSKLIKAPELEPHHQIHFSVISRTPLLVKGLPPR